MKKVKLNETEFSVDYTINTLTRKLMKKVGLNETEFSVD